MNTFKRDNNFSAWLWLGFSVMAFFILLVYSPALLHPPRADQIMYLAEVAHKNNLWDLTIGSLDLNRHRQFNPGDEILFRPILYIVLGLQKYFFKYQFMYWQMAGIALHLGVVWALLNLLLTIECGWPALWATGFFALLFVNMEMVIWQHINSYMIALGLILLALTRSLRMSGDESSQQDYFYIAACLFFASLTHELANCAAFFIGLFLYVYRPQQKKWALMICAIPLIYLLCSVLNGLMHPFHSPAHKPWPEISAMRILGPAFYSMSLWFYAGVFPLELTWVTTARNMLGMIQGHLMHIPDFGRLSSLLGLVALFFYGVCAYNARVQRDIALVCGAVIVCFAVMVTYGRGTQWQMFEILRSYTYYMYFFWLFMIIVLFASIRWSLLPRVLKRFLAGLVLVLTLFNAQELYAVNAKQVTDNNDINVLVQSMELLIKEHGKEKDFSFYVDPHYPGNYIYSELENISEGSHRKYSFIEAIYPQYFTRHKPKYMFLVAPFRS